MQEKFLRKMGIAISLFLRCKSLTIRINPYNLMRSATFSQAWMKTA